MSTITDITNLTVALTRRPEIPDVTASAIRMATMRAHHTDFFPRDLTSNTIPLVGGVPPSGMIDLPNISASLVRLRSIKTIQMLSPEGRPVEELEFRSQDDLFTKEGTRRPHIYTLLGDTLRLYPLSSSQSAQIFFFQNPNLTGLQYSSWIATLYPDDIAAWAATIVFARTGFAEMANQFNQLYVVPFQQLLVASHLLGNVS